MTRVFYPKYCCPKCGIWYGQTEDQTAVIIKETCKTCSWGNRE